MEAGRGGFFFWKILEVDLRARAVRVRATLVASAALMSRANSAPSSHADERAGFLAAGRRDGRERAVPQTV